jgi:unsaturated rhamnogalacturonyl hydrolase
VTGSHTPTRAKTRLEVAEAVAARAVEYPFLVWGFGEGMALLGLLRAGALLDRPEWIDRVTDLVVPSLHGAPDPADHLIAVEVLDELARLRPDLEVEPAVRRFCETVLNASRPVPGRLAVHRPDLPDLDTTVWVDCMHTDAPGLTLAGLPGQAAQLVEEVSAALQDETGLFSHGYDVATGRANGVHWGRGQGWALRGLVSIAASAARYRAWRLLGALARWEQDGRWRAIVDDPEAPVEASVSALAAAGILHGVKSAVITADWLPLAERALAAAVEEVDTAGGLPVSEATPTGAREVYLSRGTGVFPWGQGPLLLALLDGAEMS